MTLMLVPPEVWEPTPPEAQASIRLFEARVMALEASVQQLEATVQHLPEPLWQDSRTSSQSPRAIRPRLEANGRATSPGGAKPSDRLDRRDIAGDMVLPVKPARCPRCHRPLSGEDPQPQWHQVTELPLVPPIVTEDQRHR